MYRASDELANEEWLSRLDETAERLDLDAQARTRAADVFLSTLPDTDRSKRATMAASLYVGALVAGDQRSQGTVADACDVSRLTVQQRWKEVLETAGLEAPSW